MTVQDLAAKLERALERNGLGLSLDTGPLTVTYVPNPGGFVNHSFHVRNGDVQWHFKLTGPDDVADLRKWFGVHAHLTDTYSAPRVLQWVDLPELDLSGLVFDALDAESAGSWEDVPANDLAELLRALHRDDGLAKRLPNGPRRSMARVFLDSYGERLRQDLEFVAVQKPPFVSTERFGWMERESNRLVEIARSHSAFREPATQPTHSDLWLNNVLVSNDRWWLIDWDDLGLGDPAMDFGMLGGPTADDMFRREAFDAFVTSDAERQRVRLYHRAALLDWTVDVLADWCEAGRWLEDPEPFRTGHQALHERAYEAYRELYG